MKMLQSLVVTLLALFLVSCETQFTEYRGQNIIAGKGGTIRVVDGIDFWETGEPNRKCIILGVVDDEELSDATIAKVARKHGGDAIVHGGVDRFGHIDSRMRTKLLVVKYTE